MNDDRLTGEVSPRHGTQRDVRLEHPHGMQDLKDHDPGSMQVTETDQRANDAGARVNHVVPSLPPELLHELRPLLPFFFHSDCQISPKGPISRHAASLQQENLLQIFQIGKGAGRIVRNAGGCWSWYTGGT